MAKSYVSLEKKIGEKGLVLPKEDATPQEIRETFTKIGCPPDVSGYKTDEIGWPEGIPQQPEFVQAIKEKAWQMGVPEKVFHELFSTMLDLNGRQVKDIHENGQLSRNEADASLRKDWGSAYDSNIDAAGQVGEFLWGDQWEEVASLTLADGTPLGNNASFIRGLPRLASDMGEGQIAAGRAGVAARSTRTPEEATRELAKLNGDSDFNAALYDNTHPEHKEAVERRQALYSQAYPGEASEGATATGKVIGGI